MTVLERLLKYVSVETMSVDDCETVPSTACQWNLARLLVEELTALGATKVRLSDHCYVYAEIPATTDKPLPAIGFIAHMDTSPAMSGKDVKPRLVENYDGGDIVLNEALGIVLQSADYPELAHRIGHTLVVTDGTTLLGADDKAGIAEIMTMAEYLLAHPEIPHGAVKIGFTPDEEVGRGVDFFDVEGFGADFAYTIDGDMLGGIEYENFNAASAHVALHGKSIHPGSAKGRMVNALLLGMELQSLLPVFENPMYTEGYEGFFHLNDMSGSVEEAQMLYIIRDHDRELFEKKKEKLMAAARYMNEKYGYECVTINLQDSYFNMREKIEPHMHLIDNAVKAMENLGIKPFTNPIRGGTDGARLSFMGLPCPNLCTGGGNYHGKYEYASVQEMEKVAALLVELVRLYGAE